MYMSNRGYRFEPEKAILKFGAKRNSWLKDNAHIAVPVVLLSAAALSGLSAYGGYRYGLRKARPSVAVSSIDTTRSSVSPLGNVYTPSATSKKYQDDYEQFIAADDNDYDDFDDLFDKISSRPRASSKIDIKNFYKR